MKTIAEQLHEAIDQLEAEINQHGFATLIFKIQDSRFIRFEEQFSINKDEIKCK